MSAMHWEARRRQRALERRMFRSKQQVHSSPEAASDPPQPNTDGGQCPPCQNDLQTGVHHGARIPNRYSSLQYKQQW